MIASLTRESNCCDELQNQKMITNNHQPTEKTTTGKTKKQVTQEQRKESQK